MPLPRTLSGLRVLDLCRLLPGPFATWQLAAMGASVIKVEDPAPGDTFRFLGPTVDGSGAGFHVMNRQKRNIVLDLKSPGGRDVLLRLVEDSDVLIEQFRPGVLQRLGLGEDTLRARRPSLVICRLTGYGQTGPLAQKAGHDSNFVALAGFLGLQGLAGGPAVLPSIPTGDLVGALYAVVGILAALEHLRTTGEALTVDLSMAEAVASYAAPFVAGWSQEPPSRGSPPLSGGLANYAIYDTQDGQPLAVGALEPKFFLAFAALCGHPEWGVPPPLPCPEHEVLRQKIAEVVASRTAAQWQDLLLGADCCVSLALSPAESTLHPHWNARGVVGRAAGEHGESRWIESPLGPPMTGSAAAPGADTDEILRGIGLDDAAISSLRASGAVA